jgi:hypothetical protein
VNVVQTAVAVTALVGGAYGSIHTLDSRYVPLSEWQDFQWTQLRKELRQIEKDIAEAEFKGNYDYAERLEQDYDDLLALICRKYPEDRDCG